MMHSGVLKKIESEMRDVRSGSEIAARRGRRDSQMRQWRCGTAAHKRVTNR
jgi:hypothetical protein